MRRPVFAGLVFCAFAAQAVSVVELGGEPYGIKDVSALVNAALQKGERNIHFPAGEWRLDRPLSLPSGTHITADDAARIFAAKPNEPEAIVANADVKNGNSDISIKGGLWDGYAPVHPRKGWTDPRYPGRFFHFINVDGLVIEHVRMTDSVVFYISLGRVRNFRIEDISFEGTFPVKCQDGVHIGGGCENGLVKDIRCRFWATGDDLIALNADDVDPVKYTHNHDQVDAPIRHIRVENVTAPCCHSVVRLLSVKSDITDVVFKNIRAGYREFGVNADGARYSADPMFRDADYPQGIGRLQDIVFEDCEMWYAGEKKNPHEVVDLETNGKGIRFVNFRHAREREATDNAPHPTFRFRKMCAHALTVDGKPLKLAQGEEKTLNDVRNLTIERIDAR